MPPTGPPRHEISALVTASVATGTAPGAATCVPPPIRFCFNDLPLLCAGYAQHCQQNLGISRPIGVGAPTLRARLCRFAQKTGFVPIFGVPDHCAFLAPK